MHVRPSCPAPLLSSLPRPFPKSASVSILTLTNSPRLAMPTAAFVPAEVLMTVYEYLNCAEDLLCASLVNRAWRMASIGLNKIWRRHWQAVKLSATERRRVLAKNADEVDWYAECKTSLAEAVTDRS